jgi:hypothetical protein
MFVVTEAKAALIRAAYDSSGEFPAAIELRRRFPGITDNAKARECVRIIAGWTPVAAPTVDGDEGALTGRPAGSIFLAVAGVTSLHLRRRQHHALAMGEPQPLREPAG